MKHKGSYTINKKTKYADFIDCPNITSLVFPAGFKKAKISNCPKLVSVIMPRTNHNINITNCPKLTTIRIFD